MSFCCQVRKGTGSQVDVISDKEARAASRFYRGQWNWYGSFWPCLTRASAPALSAALLGMVQRCLTPPTQQRKQHSASRNATSWKPLFSVGVFNRQLHVVFVNTPIDNSDFQDVAFRDALHHVVCVARPSSAFVFLFAFPKTGRVPKCQPTLRVATTKEIIRCKAIASRRKNCGQPVKAESHLAFYACC